MSSIAILVYLSSLAIVTLGQCPQGWTQSTLGNGKCYLVVKDVNMFDESDSHCTGEGGEKAFLTSISSKFENDYVNIKPKLPRMHNKSEQPNCGMGRRCDHLGVDKCSEHKGLVQTAMGGTTTWYWIGANSYGQPLGSTTFAWTDRTPWIYNNWAPGQPDGSPLNCAASNQGDAGRWSVQDCEAKFISVCETLSN